MFWGKVRSLIALPIIPNLAWRPRVMYCPIGFILLKVIVNAKEKVAFEIVSIGPPSSFILWVTGLLSQ